MGEIFDELHRLIDTLENEVEDNALDEDLAQMLDAYLILVRKALRGLVELVKIAKG